MNDISKTLNHLSLYAPRCLAYLHGLLLVKTRIVADVACHASPLLAGLYLHLSRRANARNVQLSLRKEAVPYRHTRLYVLGRDRLPPRPKLLRWRYLNARICLCVILFYGEYLLRTGGLVRYTYLSFYRVLHSTLLLVGRWHQIRALITVHRGLWGVPRSHGEDQQRGPR